jgi:hypothetical protein
MLGDALCDTWVAFDVLCCTASILNLAAISFDRYVRTLQNFIFPDKAIDGGGQKNAVRSDAGNGNVHQLHARYIWKRRSRAIQAVCSVHEAEWPKKYPAGFVVRFRQFADAQKFVSVTVPLPARRQNAFHVTAVVG